MRGSTYKAAVNNVGQEPTTSTEKIIDATKLKSAREQYRNWWLGFGISFIPLLALPLFEAFNSNISTKGFFIMLFGGCEVIYMGVSLGITSLNDYIKHNNKKQGRVGWNLFLVILGAVLYVLMAISKYKSKNFNDSLALSFNIVFLIIIMIIGSAEYIQQIREAK